MPFLSWHLALALLTVAMVSAGLKFQMMRRNGASSDVDIPQVNSEKTYGGEIMLWLICTHLLIIDVIILK